MQNGFGIVRVLDLGGNAKNVSALADVVLDVFVVALVCELSHFNLFRSELFVEVVEVEAGRGQVFNTGEKNGGLERRHGCLELGRNECKGLVLDAQVFVQVNRLGNEVRVEFVEPIVKESSEILGQIVGLLEARAESVGEGSDIWNVLVLANLDFILDIAL